VVGFGQLGSSCLTMSALLTWAGSGKDVHVSGCTAVGQGDPIQQLHSPSSFSRGVGDALLASLTSAIVKFGCSEEMHADVAESSQAYQA
jgi:hypothetical protein